MRCPLCHTTLPDGAEACNRCDWVRTPDLPEFNATDWIAGMLSFAPGLGHLFKGHLVSGLLLFLILGPLYLLAVFMLVPRTFGLSLLLPGLFIVVVAAHAYRIPDVRRVPGVRKHAQRTLARWFGRPVADLEKHIK
jgi:hypothetical protein